MKTKNILALALLPALTMLATACSSDDAQLQDNRVPITLTASTLTVGETRTAADTALNKGYLENGQAVRVRVRKTGGTDNDWADYTYTAGANGEMTAPATPPFYPIDNTHVDIVAYSPSFANSTFTVLSDQTTDESYLASDLVFASASNQAKSATAVPLQFEHKMAKIVVEALGNAASGVTTINSITLHTVRPQVSFNTNTGVVSTAEGDVVSIKLVKDGEEGAAAGAAAIPGQTISGDLLTIETNLGTATYSVDSKTFMAGKVYKMRITVTRAQVNTTTKITDWTTTGNVNLYSSGGDPFKLITLTNNGKSITLVMVLVKGGSYTKFRDKTNVTGTLTDYYIQQTEVNNKQWYCVMGYKPTIQYAGCDGDAYPVAGISYNEVTTANTGFLARLNSLTSSQLEGRKFKLPTEVQWEFAARGGTHSRGYIFAGSDYYNAVSWNAENSGGVTHPTGQLGANELGIYDMTGNVQEYCSDYYTATPPTALGTDYKGPAAGTTIVARGGNITSDLTTILPLSAAGNVCYGNAGYALDHQGSGKGFRLVLQ
jgi:formylglycine-generating enzyme required for sulfatase activity